MVVKKLSNSTFDEIVECFLIAFENYFVKMPTEKKYYEERWKAAKVDFNLSYGMYDGDDLVGFIIHAIDERFGKMTAFNTGTGVIPKHRGKRIVKAIYEFALKDLSKNGIVKSTLEVIMANERAIQAYKGVGFNICKNYKCFAGEITDNNNFELEVYEIKSKDFDWSQLPNQTHYSWDFQKETILQKNYQYYHVLNKGILESYFIIDPRTKYLAQFDVLTTKPNSWQRLFTGVRQVSKEIKVINVDMQLQDKVQILQSLGLMNSVNQYEMELDILTVDLF